VNQEESEQNEGANVLDDGRQNNIVSYLIIRDYVLLCPVPVL